ncbi:OmpA family protein [Wenxinia saemankumensis]|uniref:OmpA-OmpF porin, OOP family n=1 Tax=Wenxinia saemankumensis TaxID=1447782 RepID=A0A1M6FY61_9RHOB|nr:OmpA family protein [Wenxinia saemankumensis]SHJ02564.1 OmpA-OmpF porin, OOP family [Wenxinia saemankumensis]
MRLAPIIATVAAFFLAGAGSVVAARTVTTSLEKVSTTSVREALIDHGYEWVSVQSDGLQVVLEGEAPSEAARFRAISTAGGVVDASRVIDSMRVAETDRIEAPDFAVEILRNDSGISLIGLIPAAMDRGRLDARIDDASGDQPVADFLEAADYPMPPTWRAAMDYALASLRDLPQSKISVTAERVTITAIAESEAEKSRIETRLARTLPDGVGLSLVVTAPRPVVTPFAVRFRIDETGAGFETCNADTEESQRRISAAAMEAGAEAPLSCPLALGVPSPDWGAAVETGIDGLAEIGGGSVTFTDGDVLLVAAEGTDPDLFDRVAGELANALPEGFAFEAVLPEAPRVGETEPPAFTATLSPEGAVQIRGRVPDEMVNSMVENLAVARFGREDLTMGTRVAADLPQGWSVRIMAGVEALSMLSNGSLVIGPDELAIRGSTGDPEASAEISALLVEKLGEEATFTADIAYEESLDPVVGLPTPEECIRRIGIVTQGRRILFDPGSATLTGETQNVIDDIAEILRQCLDLPMEIAGYTDSQGSEDGNQRLSQQRADAVLSALRARRVPVSTFSAVGYGEADPIADNETEAGREANRRIEFRIAGAGAAGDDGADPESDADGAGEEAGGADDADASEEAAADEAATEQDG